MDETEFRTGRRADGTPITPENQGVIVIPIQARMVWLTPLGRDRVRMFINDEASITTVDLHSLALAELVEGAKALLNGDRGLAANIDARDGSKLEGGQGD